VAISLLKKSDLHILKTIQAKFPQTVYVMTHLYRKDENFREICEDYVLCLESIDKIIVTNKSNNRILEEYKKALNELEIEMLDYLQSASSQ